MVVPQVVATTVVVVVGQIDGKKNIINIAQAPKAADIETDRQTQLALAPFLYQYVLW